MLIARLNGLLVVPLAERDGRVGVPLGKLVLVHKPIGVCPFLPPRRGDENSPAIYRWGGGKKPRESRRDGRNSARKVTVRSSLRDLRRSIFPIHPAVNCWAIVERPYGTGARCDLRITTSLPSGTYRRTVARWAVAAIALRPRPLGVAQGWENRGPSGRSYELARHFPQAGQSRRVGRAKQAPPWDPARRTGGARFARPTYPLPSRLRQQGLEAGAARSGGSCPISFRPTSPTSIISRRCTRSWSRFDWSSSAPGRRRNGRVAGRQQSAQAAAEQSASECPLDDPQPVGRAAPLRITRAIMKV